MAQSQDETRGYMRGYGRGVRRMGDRVRRALEIARAYRERSMKAEVSDGRPPTCQSCVRWTRGRVGEASCLWGTCRADFEYFAGEGSMWVDYPNEGKKICTHETFGCINWIPRAANPVSVEGA